jgi:tRNA modification GTPase
MQFIGNPEDTIVAPATPPGVSALAIVRMSGKQAITIMDSVFPGKDLQNQQSHTIHFGTLRHEEEIIDEVVVSIYIVEISTHGSPYIVQKVLKILIENGARMAQAGEFSKRAFLNGQFDLAQAEAVADLIHSDSEASHRAAITQMRGGFSKQIENLREELIHFASMIELELDFSEEDVQFASREELKKLINNLLIVVDPLIQSYDLGNVIKNGVPTVIAGKPNAGKSTLLNELLNEERAIVSEIAGTTRDSIEDEINIGGVHFRFIDTAGLRDTTDTIEKIGVERTRKKMKEASLILFMFDLTTESKEHINSELEKLELLQIPYIPIGNKVDKASSEAKHSFSKIESNVQIDAKTGEGVDQLKEVILRKVHLDEVKKGDVIVTNIRHYENLLKAKQALSDVLAGVDNGITNDFLALELRNALYSLSEITGQEISSEDLLANIFSKFCIGK